jgi:hypothetical protein
VLSDTLEAPVDFTILLLRSKYEHMPHAWTLATILHNLKQKLLIILIAIISYSCDYFTDQKVLVIDRTTKMPLDSAEIRIGPYDFVTDSTGFYHIRRVTGNLTERTIKVTKHGYLNFELTLEFDDDQIIYKQKADSIYNFSKNAFSVMNDTLIVHLETE